MTQEIWLIDAFAESAFKGNPAGVCLLPHYPADRVLQDIAAEMNQAETAFLVKMDAGNYRLRWFTPAAEIKLCGHATLASAHLLRETGAAATGDTMGFHTLSGLLQARLLPSGIELDFPALPGTQAEPPPALTQGIGAGLTACEWNGANYVVEVADYQALLACAPDMHKLRQLPGVGVGVTTAVGVPAGFDFASRYFAPNYGVDEDPVTGSVHCLLAPFWAKRLGRKQFRALQASRRSGVLELRLEGDRIFMSGTAVTLLRGTLQLPPETWQTATAA